MIERNYSDPDLRALEKMKMTRRKPIVEPSPIPWKACHDGECVCGQVWSIPQDFPVFTARGQVAGMCHKFMADAPDMIYAEIDTDQSRANAKLIVEAVNSHASNLTLISELVGALEEIKLLIDVPGQALVSDCRAAAQIANTVLARAKASHGAGT